MHCKQPASTETWSAAMPSAQLGVCRRKTSNRPAHKHFPIWKALQTALTYCRNLPETTDYERNLKNVLTIAIRHAMGYSPAETDFPMFAGVAGWNARNGRRRRFRRAPLWLPHEEYVYSLGKDWNAACRQERSEAENHRQDSNVVVAPNPAADFVQVSFPAHSGAWYISNITGSMIQEGQVSDVPFRIGTADWPEGLYFLNWQSPIKDTRKLS